MSNILLVRDNLAKSSNTTLLEHQAILGITRSILANYSRDGNGMHLSEHKVLVPAHLDILPLLTLVADDYTELVEPEPERVTQISPFIPYSDELSEPPTNQILAEQFLQPRWFASNRERNNLEDTVYIYHPSICVLLGNTRETIERLIRLNYQFAHLITFNSLMVSNEELYRLNNNARRITIADQQFRDTVVNSMRNLNMPSDDYERIGFWSDMYNREERQPDLEPFVAYGAAFEMAMFLNDQSF